jgi:probable rRNA maturation factor
MPEPPPLRVTFIDKQDRRIPAARLTRVLRGAARALRVRGELALVLCGDARIRSLNRRYRRKDRATDVLSFPGPGGDEGIGDVVISVATAARNARRFGRSVYQELEILALHGFLHTLGFDHETDDGEMDRLESRLRQNLLPRGFNKTSAPARETQARRAAVPPRRAAFER